MAKKRTVQPRRNPIAVRIFQDPQSEAVGEVPGGYGEELILDCFNSYRVLWRKKTKEGEAWVDKANQKALRFVDQSTAEERRIRVFVGDLCGMYRQERGRSPVTLLWDVPADYSWDPPKAESKPKNIPAETLAQSSEAQAEVDSISVDTAAATPSDIDLADPILDPSATAKLTSELTALASPQGSEIPVSSPTPSTGVEESIEDADEDAPAGPAAGHLLHKVYSDVEHCNGADDRAGMEWRYNLRSRKVVSLEGAIWREEVAWPLVALALARWCDRQGWSFA
jgi:hypothetical protein